MSTLRLHQYFQSGAVLQQGSTITVSGWSSAAAIIKLEIAKLALAVTTHADNKGAWALELLPLDAGGPYEILVSSIDRDDLSETILLEDVYVGDVFLLAGQSNMELPLSRCLDKMGERFDGYEDRLIREIKAPIQSRFDTPASDWLPGAQWVAASNEQKYQIGALGLGFAKKYRENLSCAVGLVNIAVGGSPNEAWMPSSYRRMEPGLMAQSERFADASYRESKLAEEAAAVNAWYASLADEALPGEGGDWSATNFPQLFIHTDLEDYIGSLWLRRRFDLTAADAAHFDAQKLHFGTLIDADTIYLNGVVIGETGYRYPPRRYAIPAGLLREGENEILVRLIVHRGCGGSVPSRFYGLQSKARRLSLAGSWEMTTGRSLERMPDTTTLQYLPWSLYNGLVMPIQHLPFAATLWYQGEGNDGRPHAFEPLFRDFISEWQRLFGADTPFVYFQLSHYVDPTEIIPPAAWAEIRQAQLRVADTAGTAMVVTYDVGEVDDLHPQDKWTLGLRAFEALERLRAGEAGPIIVGVPPEM